MSIKSLDELAIEYANNKTPVQLYPEQAAMHRGLESGFKAGHASRDEELKAKDERIAELEERASGIEKENVYWRSQALYLQSQVQLLEEALKSAHDHFVEHYNKAPCFHCKYGYEQCKEALKELEAMRGKNG